MKKFFLFTPQREKVVITVDDDDAWRLRNQLWKAKRNQSCIEIYLHRYQCIFALGREILGVADEGVCVIHKNGNSLDFQKGNLEPVSKIEHSSKLHLRRRQLKFNMCGRGHALTADNIYICGGGVVCRTCNIASGKKRYKKRMAAAQFVNETLDERA